jgi:beta-lactamase class A
MRGTASALFATVLAAAMCAAAPAPAAPAPGKWRPHVRAARAYARARAGSVSFAVRTPHHLYRYRAYRTAPSASVVKAMLMVAYLNRRSVRHRRLRGPDFALLSPMIRRSDNVAATRVRDIVGNGALWHLARRVHMRRFHTAANWGETQITAADQSRLFLRIDRFVVRRHRRAAMRLLNTITPSQRWGVARARPRGWALYFKSGWGSGSGAVDHQAALLRRGRRRVALAILTTNSPSHAYAKQTLRGVARRLLKGLRPGSVPR